MTPRFLFRFLLVLWGFTAGGTAPLLAQDTRGSLVPNGLVTLADGTTVEVEDLKAGAALWTWLPEGKPGTVKVTAVRRQHTDTFLLLKTSDRELRATGSQRVALSGGKLVRLDTLKAGDKIWVGGTKGPVDAVVLSVRFFPATLVAYDLMVEGHLPFLVDGVLVGD